MTTHVDGTTGVDKVQDGTIVTDDLSAGCVTPAKTQVGALPSMVRLNTANGYGSTNVCIRRFTNTVTNQGTAITYADSATLGANFTINTTGTYAISYVEESTTVNQVGVGLSLNTTTPTTSLLAANITEILSFSGCPTSNNPSFCSWVGYLPQGSIVRPHTSGLANVNITHCHFTIVRIA